MKKYIGFILSGIFMVGGICLFILALTTKVPAMSEPGWFEASRARSFKFFGASALIILSIPSCFISFSILKGVERIKNSSYEQENSSFFANENKGWYCSYCETLNRPSDRKCVSCGSSRRKNK